MTFFLRLRRRLKNGARKSPFLSPFSRRSSAYYRSVRQMMQQAMILEAAILVQDATHDRQTNHVRGCRALRFYRFYHRAGYRYCCQAIALLHLCLAFVEAPTSGNNFYHGDARNKNALAAIELVFLASYALDLYIKRVALGHTQWAVCLLYTSPSPRDRG